MKSPSKEASDPNMGPAMNTRKRASMSPLSVSPVKINQKRRLSKKDRRRVSFAPDPELTMVHTFEKDDDQSAEPSPLIVTARPTDPASEPFMHHAHGHPALRDIPEIEPLPLGSPLEVSMDITQPVADQQHVHGHSNNAWMPSAPGDVTAAVPSLADLAEADELDAAAVQQQQHQEPVAFISPGRPSDAAFNPNITAAIPGFGDLVDEDENAAHAVENAVPGVDEGMDLTMAVGRVLETHPGGVAEGAAPGAAPPAVTPAADGRTPSLSPGQLAVGQVNKWGFVPGGDDTLNIDLELHGHMIMGDQTFNRMYHDNTTGNTIANWGANVGDVDSPLDLNPVKQQQQQQVIVAKEQPVTLPNWTAPAFLPPYMSEEYDEEHPALRRSPEMSNSSLNTMSTRRISVDARRQSVNSRRASVVSLGGVTGGHDATAGTAGLLADATAEQEEVKRTPVMHRRRSSIRGRPSDVTDNLLREEIEEFEGVEDGESGGFLAGLKKQMRLLSKGSSPMVMAGGESFPSPDPTPLVKGANPFPHAELPTVQEEEEEAALAAAGVGAAGAAVPVELQGQGGIDAATKTPATAAVSVGYADSHHVTAALLKTGGTTGLLQDTLHGQGLGGEDVTHPSSHGTTRLLKMDVTASSAINSRLQQQQGLMSPMSGTEIGDDGAAPTPGVEPHMGAYPEVDTGALPTSVIPGGPRLARTPVSALSNGSLGRAPQLYHNQQGQKHAAGAGGSPAVGGGAPGAMPQSVHSVRSASVYVQGTTPGTHRLGRPSLGAVSLPGSAITARYPGSAAAVHRLSHGFTPLHLQPITFQDFAKMMDVQFLDNLRRGASINYADLQPNTVPSSLGNAYRLMCVISPNVAELEVAIHTLQTEGARLRSNSADMEAELGQSNPPIFRHVQTASQDQLEVFRSNVGVLKKVCRQKAVALLKDVRCQMEESKRRRLQRGFAGLQSDLSYIQEYTSHMGGVAAAAEAYAVQMREQMQGEVSRRKQEAEVNSRLVAARAALAEQQAANAERRSRLEAARARVVKLQGERAALESERAELATTAEDLAAAVQRSQLAAQQHADSDAAPQAVLHKLRALDSLQSALGWQLESVTEDPIAAEAVIKVRGMFRLRVVASKGGVKCEVEVLQDGCPVPADRQALAAAMVGAANVSSITLAPAATPAAVQALNWRLSRAADLVTQELEGLRMACRTLCDARYSADGSIKLCFVNLDQEVRFGVTLRPGATYPVGPMGVDVKVWFGGEGAVSQKVIEAAVAGVPKRAGRIRAAALALSELARQAKKPEPLASAAAAAAHQPQAGGVTEETPAAAAPVEEEAEVKPEEAGEQQHEGGVEGFVAAENINVDENMAEAVFDVDSDKQVVNRRQTIFENPLFGNNNNSNPVQQGEPPAHDTLY